MKKCPYCAEEILDDAIKCRFCGEFIKKRKKWLNCLFGCLIAILVSILLVILVMYLSFLLLKFIVYKIFFQAPRPPYYSPIFPPGLEFMLRNFSEFLRDLWQKLWGLFGMNVQKVI